MSIYENGVIPPYVTNIDHIPEIPRPVKCMECCKVFRSRVELGDGTDLCHRCVQDKQPLPSECWMSSGVNKDHGSDIYQNPDRWWEPDEWWEAPDLGSDKREDSDLSVYRENGNGWRVNKKPLGVTVSGSCPIM